jgi:hypothetical protein
VRLQAEFEHVLQHLHWGGEEQAAKGGQGDNGYRLGDVDLLDDEVNGLTINGNTFAGRSTAGVWSVGGVNNSVITSNLFMDCGGKLAKNSP